VLKLISSFTLKQMNFNTFTFPKRTQYEEERNYFWEKYFQPSLLNRQNWKYMDYELFENSTGPIDLIYSSNAKMNIRGNINANIYDIVEVISDKVKINKKLQFSEFVPKMFFHFNDRQAIEDALTRNFFYLKGATGSTSKSTFIVNKYSEIKPIIKAHPEISDWFLSENINSFLYKRKGSYQPGGIVYNEKIGHKGRMKFFILLRVDSESKEVYMYDQSVFEIAPDEFQGDLTSRPQNIIIGMGSEDLPGYPDDYDTDPDYGFSPVHVFGKENYFKVIVPQLGKMTQDLFSVVENDLYCKNDKYYNSSFKTCFHFGTVDVIITPDLKCYFLEVNTKPVMDRPSYESIINYPSMIDSIVQICIDPYYPPHIPSTHKKGWHKISTVKRNAKKTFYISPTWKFSNEVKEFFKKRKDWEEIVYPKYLLENNKIDFVGKRKEINEDTVFSKGKLISKILTLDHYLGNKKNMYDILSNDQRSFRFLPKTLTFTLNDKRWKSKIKKLPNKYWILKPSIGLRGQDIFISNNKSEIISLVEQHSNYTDWVLSEYIKDPYLLKINKSSPSGAVFNDAIGRKTHIRIYVLITKINGKYHIYLYDKPLIFAAAKEYNNDISDSYAQLTNLYLGSNYYTKVLGINGALAYQDLSFSLVDVLNQLYGPSFYQKKVLPQIKNILRVVLDNSKEYLHCSLNSKEDGKNCFQNIALDLMPDSRWKIFLLEVNGKPGMNAPSYQWGGTLKDYTDSLLNNILNDKNNKNGKKYKNNKNNKGFILVK
jgi:hypothetical protein